MAKTLTKQELKQPDEFITWGTRAAAYAEKHLAIVIIGALIPIVVVGAIFAINYGHEQTEREAGAKLYVGEKLLAGDNEGPMRGMHIPGMNDPKPEDQLAAIAAFEKVAKEYPGSKEERRAHLLAGDTYYGMDKFDDAAKEYDAVSGGTDLERYYALSGKAHALEGKQAWDDAASTYRKIVDDSANLDRDIATLDLARVLAKAGKAEEAKTLLGKFATDFPNSALKDDASAKLTDLGGTPAPAATPAKPEAN